MASIDWKSNADKIMAISATVTAVIALVVAVLQVRSEREFQKLSVEPYLEIGSTGNADSDFYSFLLFNNGLGPAVIGSTEIRINGSNASNWAEAVPMVLGPGVELDFTYSDVDPNRRIRAEQIIELFKIAPYDETARQLQHRMVSGNIEYRVCYCSIYGDCWESAFDGEATHLPVSACPID